jgi:phytoene synthase
MAALFAIDAAMEDVVARSTEPTLGRIKLAWWREQLEALDSKPAPAEPRLQAAAAHLLPKGITGAEVANLELGWAALLDEPIDFSTAWLRGVALFQLGAKLLGASDPHRDAAGILVGLASAARIGREPPRDLVVTISTSVRGEVMPRGLRCITGLARLAVRDLRGGVPYEPEGSRSRAFQFLVHLWTGRVW